MGQLVPFPNFVGGTYASVSPVAGGVERSINLYPETIESGAGKNKYWLRRRPGYKLAATCPAGPLQALYTVNGRTFAIAGSKLWEIVPQESSPETYFVNNPVAGSGSNVLPTPMVFKNSANDRTGYYHISANASQLLILPNDTLGTGWIFQYGDTPGSANTLTQITASGFVSGSVGAYVDGYFVVNQGTFQTGSPRNANRNFQVSALNDGTTWDGVNTQAVNDYPDQLIAPVNFLHYLQLFGSRHSEAFYNTGSNSTIFARYEGSYQYVGLAAPWSLVYLDNAIFYLGQDDRGQIVVYRLEGFTPKRVSDYSFESAVQQYAAVETAGFFDNLSGLSPTISDAYAYGYQEDGHLFYVITFPNGNSADGTQGAGATWAYDVNEQKWHERAAWVTETSSPYQSHYASDLAMFHTFNFGVHLVGGGGGDTTGNIYIMSSANADDNGNPLRWLRRAPHLYSENVRNFYHQFILGMKVGSASQSGQGSDPTIGLQYSQDGGQTWSAELDATSGTVGQYKKRVTWDCLGSGRDYVFQVFGSDPSPQLAISDAYLFLSQGIS